MNDFWANKRRTPQETRASRRFRHHILRPGNPRGRVIRMPCFFCPAGEEREPPESHHPDYAQWYLVAWLCTSHHRQVDHGSLTLPKRALWNYSSLLRTRAHRRPHAAAP